MTAKAYRVWMRYTDETGREGYSSPTTKAHTAAEAEIQLTSTYKGFGATDIEVTRIDVMASWGLWERTWEA